MAFLFPPSPLVQYGSTHLVYEMRLTNYSPEPYQIVSLDVAAGPRTFSFTADELKNMARILGRKPPADASERIDGGSTAIIYLTLDLGHSPEIPAVIQHTLYFSSSAGERHALVAPPLNVSQQTPTIVAPPLHGPNWIAGDSSHNGHDAAHRRSIQIVGGEPWLAQRYAIDWVKYRMANGVATTWSGTESQNSSYFCYNEPVLSVGAGRVVAALDGIPENIPHSGKYAVDINLINAGGNYVVVDIGGGRYAFYAHMRPGSVKVKVGDQVTVGQILGNVGNTGSSTEPHLHMHIMDRPSFLAAHGVPYGFTQFKASGPAKLHEKASGDMEFSDVGALTMRNNDYPATNAAVEFP